MSCIPTPTHLLHDDDIVNLPDEDVRSHINSYYESIVQALHYSSCVTVPRKMHGFYKFWWAYEELTLLKEKAIQSFNVCAALGKPRTGIAFDDMRRDRAADKPIIRLKERNGKMEFSDSLNDALMNKHMDRFWRSWRSKFNHQNVPFVIDGLFVEKAILLTDLLVFLNLCRYLIRPSGTSS